MENCYDFLEWLGPDNSVNVLLCLDEPSDLVRTSLVSRSWRQFVIENGFCKKLCLRMHPEISRFTRVIEVSNSTEPIEVSSSNALEWESLEREHRIYAGLAHSIMSSDTNKACIDKWISASSTDNYPEESIENTLIPNEKVDGRPSYWSSEGEKDPEVPETLTYRLISNLCVVSEVNIQPFKAYFQHGDPIYSAKAVRFRMGHPKSFLDVKSSIMDAFAPGQRSDNDDYVWTYISPEFPMVQENRLQTFKLPQPVICIGGILQIELLGRVQQQEMDNLYYICVCHVEVVGRSLSPAFDIDILDFPGNWVLKYFPEAENCDTPKQTAQDEGSGSSGWHALTARIRQIRAGRVWDRVVILNSLLGNVDAVDNDDSNESDEELVA
ncbi:F-box protein At4g00755-like isoform X2 [Magnolia sinica]|nr:F-box protein At4g00755-like isoform X2 [Magnolia sinica]